MFDDPKTYLYHYSLQIITGIRSEHVSGCVERSEPLCTTGDYLEFIDNLKQGLNLSESQRVVIVSLTLLNS